LFLSGNTLFGAASSGGASGAGTVFAIGVDGTRFTVICSLDDTNGGGPNGGVILYNNTLYGTAYGGGSGGYGTVFRVVTDGTSFIALHNFTAPFGGRNSDGYYPVAGVVASGNRLYGTASGGGTRGFGTVYRTALSGSDFTVLHNFPDPSPFLDGGNPSSSLALSGSTLYGTAYCNGSEDSGTIFSLNTDGNQFRTLYNFSKLGVDSSNLQTNVDGASPVGELILSGSTLFGIASAGGEAGRGTIFGLTLPITPPELTIIPSQNSVILAWSTNSTGFTLQSTTNLGSPIWTSASPPPVMVSDLYTVTNPISGTQQFYRLAR
jgi:uncharacterized repeat protein (TIGR03803 family)